MTTRREFLATLGLAGGALIVPTPDPRRWCFLFGDDLVRRDWGNYVVMSRIFTQIHPDPLTTAREHLEASLDMLKRHYHAQSVPGTRVFHVEGEHALYNRTIVGLSESVTLPRRELARFRNGPLY